MAKQKNIQKQDGLEKFLAYMLGRQPDEFGLAPDEQGFVPLKELLAALHDEEGFRGVREGQLMMLANQPGQSALLEIQDGRARLTPARSFLPPEPPSPESRPKALYLALKPAAWIAIVEKGLYPKTGETFVRLWAEAALALRFGRRLSPEPVLVTVNTALAVKGRAVFQPYSERLWLTTYVPQAALSGPPTPPKTEELPPRRKKEETPEKPGSFYPRPPEAQVTVHHGKKKGKYGDAPDWKNQTRRDRRQRGGPAGEEE